MTVSTRKIKTALASFAAVTALAGTAAITTGAPAANAFSAHPEIVVLRQGVYSGVGVQALTHLSAGHWVVYFNRTVGSCVEIASLADSGRVGEIRAFGGVYGTQAVEVDEYDVNGTAQDQTFQLFLDC